MSEAKKKTADKTPDAKPAANAAVQSGAAHPRADSISPAGRPEARLPKGMRDVEATEIRAMERMFGQIRCVYESYGFEPLDTPAFEYTDALGKFLPDQDRPNEGVFSFQDEEEQWFSLRYDLTAPLARYVAQNFDALPKPFRRYAVGPVWRNEKPGPGRFRQFMQFDADTVGTDNIAADAEICMLAADTLEALGLNGHYRINVSNRKILDGLMDVARIPVDDFITRQRVLRALDKLDKFSLADVKLLLGTGRKDESGDFTKGAGLEPEQIEIIMRFVRDVTHGSPLKDKPNVADAEIYEIDGTEFYTENKYMLDACETSLRASETGMAGVSELRQMLAIWEALGFGSNRIQINPAVVRGLEYYTGPVFEAELTFPMHSEDGTPVRFGSVGGGGRYDGLVSRFRGTQIGATGFSIGVSRLYAALSALGKLKNDAASGPVVILAMDHDALGEYSAMARELREGGIRAEVYLGTSGMKAQMKYADKRGAPCVVIQGGDERARGEVTIKDLVQGKQLSGAISDNQTWREGRPAQVAVPRAQLVETVRDVIARQKA